MSKSNNEKFSEFDSQQQWFEKNKTSLLSSLPRIHFGWGIKNKFKTLINKLLGTKISERYWKYKYKGGKEQISIEFNLHNYRYYFLNEIKKSDFETAFEIGCNWGPNLQMIANCLQYKKLAGIDISRECVDSGNKLFGMHNYRNIQLFNGNVTELGNIIIGKYDLVFTWACLMYISTYDINKVIASILKIAKKRILLAEFHSTEINKSIFDGHWIHNYEKLFSLHSEKIQSLNISKITEMYNSDKWKKYGYYIDVNLKNDNKNE